MSYSFLLLNFKSTPHYAALETLSFFLSMRETRQPLPSCVEIYIISSRSHATPS